MALKAATTEGITEVPGARKLVESLASARIALVTSAADPLARARMGVAGVSMPEVLMSGDQLPVGKPDPAPFLFGSCRLGASPGRRVVFEDSTAGIRGAVSAGMKPIVVGTLHAETTRRLICVPDLEGIEVSLVNGGETVELSIPCGLDSGVKRAPSERAVRMRAGTYASGGAVERL